MSKSLRDRLHTSQQQLKFLEQERARLDDMHCSEEETQLKLVKEIILSEKLLQGSEWGYLYNGMFKWKGSHFDNDKPEWVRLIDVCNFMYYHYTFHLSDNLAISFDDGGVRLIQDSFNKEELSSLGLKVDYSNLTQEIEKARKDLENLESQLP